MISTIMLVLYSSRRRSGSLRLLVCGATAKGGIGGAGSTGVQSGKQIKVNSPF